GTDRILELINKKVKLNDIITLNKLLSNLPIQIRYNFIIGFPTETQKEIEATLKLIERLGNDNSNMVPPFLNIYTPYPGTPLYDLAVKCGLEIPKTTDEWCNFKW